MAKICDPVWNRFGKGADIGVGTRTVEEFIRAAGLPKARPFTTGRPDYQPERWNRDDIRFRANCYGYALNRAVWLHPGEIGKCKPADTLCRRFNKAVADGLHPAPLENPPDIEGYYTVALVDGHGWHWYRKDKNGLWSHKDGDGPASNRDASGALITDPRTADRGVYRNFIGYFYVPC